MPSEIMKENQWGPVFPARIFILLELFRSFVYLLLLGPFRIGLTDTPSGVSHRMCVWSNLPSALMDVLHGRLERKKRQSVTVTLNRSTLRSMELMCYKSSPYPHFVLPLNHFFGIS